MGLGHVGLPLAKRVADCGYSVTGIDTDRELVAALAQSAPHERLTVDTGESALSRSDIVILCVPTPLKDALPDMSFVKAAAESVAARLSHQLVILESTSYPGTTQDLLQSILERSGLTAGTDFWIGFSPERIDPGNTRFTLVNTPKIVSGIDEFSTLATARFYSTLVDEVIPVSSPAVAEMAKLLENTYRHVNIALANEMAILCNDLGIDVWEVVDAASTKPFGFQAFYPGPGWGGHCIPVDPSYLSWRVRDLGHTAKFVELATDFNNRMPAYVVERVVETLESLERPVHECSVLVLGVSYKPETSDCRNSPAIEIIAKLTAAGALVTFHDPLVGAIQVGGSELKGKPGLDPDILSKVDLVLLHTPNSAFDPSWIAAHAKLIFDTRNFFKGVSGNIVKL